MKQNKNNLISLWNEARKYGLVTLNTNDDGSFRASIKFSTPDHTEAVSRSKFENQSPEEALEQAIMNARKFIGDVVDIEGLGHKGEKENR